MVYYIEAFEPQQEIRIHEHHYMIKIKDTQQVLLYYLIQV